MVENCEAGQDLAAEFFQLCCRFENVHNKMGKIPAIKEGTKDKTKLRGEDLVFQGTPVLEALKSSEG